MHGCSIAYLRRFRAVEQRKRAARFERLTLSITRSIRWRWLRRSAFCDVIGTPALFQAQRSPPRRESATYASAKISKRARDLIARSYGIRLAADLARDRQPANTASINNGISITRREIQLPQIVQFSQILPIRRNNVA